MFSNISWSELLVVAAIALIVVGPKDLPALLRQLGKAFGTIRRMGNEFKAEINKVASLDEVKDVKNSITEPLKNTHEELTNQFNISDDTGVKPSGSLKPKTEGAESVADEIREAVGMEPAPAPNPAAAAESMKAAVSKAQAQKAEDAASAAAEAEKPKPAPRKKTTTRKSPARKTAAKTTTAKTTRAAAKSTTAKKASSSTATRRTTTRKKASTAKSGDDK